MNILIITDAFYPIISGVSSVASMLIKSLQKEGYTVTLCTDNTNLINFDLGCDLINIPVFRKSFWFFIYDIYYRKINYEKYDMIIFNGTSAVVSAGKALSDKVLSKSVMLLQGVEVEWVYEKSTLSSYLLNYSKYHRRAFEKSKYIVSVSSFGKQKFLEKTGLIHLKDKIYISNLYIDEDVFYPVLKKDISSKIQTIAKGRTILISVSRIIKEKGYKRKFDIFKRLLKEDSSFVWIIIGSGLFYAELERMIINENLSDYIFLLGAVNRLDLKYYYTSADCFWLLSEYDENFPLVYLEAQACGLPAIGMNKGGVVETISDKTGYLINSDYQCIELLKNRDFLKFDKGEIISFAKNFNEYDFIHKILNI